MKIRKPIEKMRPFRDAVKIARHFSAEDGVIESRQSPVTALKGQRLKVQGRPRFTWP